MTSSVEVYQDSSDPSEWRWRVTRDGDPLAKSSEGFSKETHTRNNLGSFPIYCRPVDIKTATSLFVL